MKLSSPKFAVAMIVLTGLAAFVLYSGEEKEPVTPPPAFPPFQTAGENRILNIFRRKKIPVGPVRPFRVRGTGPGAVSKTDNLRERL